MIHAVLDFGAAHLDFYPEQSRNNIIAERIINRVIQCGEDKTLLMIIMQDILVRKTP